MISSSLRIRALAAALAIVSLGLTYSDAQPAPAAPPTPAFSDEPLVIANRTLTHAGKTMPATVQNAVELLRQRYPDANINIVGVENVPIGDLTLNWRRHAARNDDGLPVWRDPPLRGVLHALMAVSKFMVQFDSSDGWNFLLRAPDVEPEAAKVRTEVFNLSALLPVQQRTTELKKRLQELELRLAVGEKSHSRDHPHISGLTEEVEVIKGLLAQMTPSSDAAAKELIDQIEAVVRLTLSSHSASAKPPVFQFHAGTQLLIATGDLIAIQATEKVLAAMRGR